MNDVFKILLLFSFSIHFGCNSTTNFKSTIAQYESNNYNNLEEISKIDPIDLLLIDLGQIPTTNDTNDLKYNVAKIVEMKKDFHYLKSQEFIVKIDKLLNEYRFETNGPSDIVRELLFFKLKVLSQLEMDPNPILECLGSLGILNWNNNYMDQYHFLRKLYYQSVYLNMKARNYHALAVIDYGLHLIEQSQNCHDFQRIQADFFRRKGSILLNERAQGVDTAAFLFLERSIILYDKLNLKNELLFSKINQCNINYKGKSNEDLIKCLIDIEADVIRATPFVRSYYYLNLGFNNFLENKYEIAWDTYQKGLKQLNVSKCGKLHFVYNTYMADAAIKGERIDDAKQIINKLREISNCNEVMSNYVDFYSSRLKTDLIKKSTQNNSDNIPYNSLTDLYIRRREAATELFVDDTEYHLGDFYAENCSDILNVFYKKFGNDIPVEHQTLIIHLIRETKSRELKRKQTYDNDKESKIRSEIAGCLREIDDFKMMDNYSDPIYAKLYHLYEELESMTDTVANPKEFKILPDLDSLRTKLIENNSQVVEFFAFGDEYYTYYINDNNFELNRIDRSIVDSLIKNFKTSIYSKSNTTKTISKELKRLLFPNGIYDSRPMVCIADGRIGELPFDYIFSDVDMDFSQHYDIYRYIKEDTIVLNKELFSIFSYSSEKSLNDVQPKDYIELEGGMEECKLLHQIFHQSQLFEDESFSESTISENFSNDILHFSTHGFSNTNNRQDCYLVIRNIEGTSEKLYSTDIEQISKSPKFVCLSTCNSGLGNYLSAEGVFSISRSFLGCGTLGVLKTLWDVDDQITKEFIIEFYSNWNAGETISRSLKLAQYHIKSLGYEHPYYWAGFVIEGNVNLLLQ